MDPSNVPLLTTLPTMSASTSADGLLILGEASVNTPTVRKAYRYFDRVRRISDTVPVAPVDPFVWEVDPLYTFFLFFSFLSFFFFFFPFRLLDQYCYR